MENASSRSDIFGKQSSSSSQFKRNLGRPSCHAQRPSYWPPFSASCSRASRESKSATSHEKHRETGTRVLEVLDKIFRAEFVAQKQMVQTKRKPPSWRLGVRNGTNSEKNMEAWTSTSYLSGSRWSCEKSKN